ncbi:hypothetical protein ACFVH7_22880 [Kitasatospora indigofera]|uniref:hypothetical protein n=1 Tax=Kitasatospora indigofera TaxID=67307 RepID=UPI00364111C4
MTNNRPDDLPEPAPTPAELRLAWQRAKALWSSAPDDNDAYSAFINAGTALYRNPPQAAATTVPRSGTDTPRAPGDTTLPAYLRLSPLHQRSRPWHAPTP